MKKYRTKFNGVVFSNRWKQKKYSRDGSWTFIGVGMRYCAWDMLYYKLYFFGFDLSVWFKKILNEENSGNV